MDTQIPVPYASAKPDDNMDFQPLGVFLDNPISLDKWYCFCCPDQPSFPTYEELQNHEYRAHHTGALSNTRQVCYVSPMSGHNVQPPAFTLYGSGGTAVLPSFDGADQHVESFHPLFGNHFDQAFDEPADPTFTPQLADEALEFELDDLQQFIGQHNTLAPPTINTTAPYEAAYTGTPFSQAVDTTITTPSFVDELWFEQSAMPPAATGGYEYPNLEDQASEMPDTTMEDTIDPNSLPVDGSAYDAESTAPRPRSQDSGYYSTPIAKGQQHGTAPQTTREKLFHCPYNLCNHQYTTRQQLEGHAASKHNGEVVYCDHDDACGLAFTDKSNMRRHKNTKHGVPKRSNVPQAANVCPQCSKKLEGRNDNRWRHINKCKGR